MAQTQNKLPKKHHYLPVFYLKGFTNSNGVFHVYDKITNKVYQNSRPENFFCENNLNSYKKDGEVKITLENTLFSMIDSDTAPLLKKLINDGDNSITQLERMVLLHFFVTLFWRLPTNTKIHSEIIDRYGFLNDYLTATQKGVELSSDRIQDLNKLLINDEETKKLVKHSIPVTAGAEEVLSLYKKWNIQTILKPGQIFVISDNPFLINNPDIKINNIFNELLIPLSSKHLLILSKDAPRLFDSWMHFDVNLSIFHQANRFIACSDLEYLNKLIGYSRKAEALLGLNKQVEETFDYMRILSTLKNEEEYFSFHSRLKAKI
ncbi:MAG: hypothetical protein K0S53_3131 [Bacteroidetes bacterium]|jgi:hypothetical protein|nr:hypothetical protein [Bacteroidota bacterium]